MQLSVIIPVWNDPEGLARLLLQLRDMRLARQIIIVDDGSDIACSPILMAEYSRQSGVSLPLQADDPLPGTEVIWLRSPASLGAGHARNIGLEQARGEHVLFFDADDTLTPNLTALIDDLEDVQFDFAMFRHHDSRVLERGGTGPLEPDASYWRAIRVRDRPFALDPEAATTLCRVSAYPWNKIWRRAFLEEARIRCTEIPVHNDIEHHWSGFLEAETILASERIGCVHHVATGRQQLTNRRDAERLRVFEALEAVADRFSRVLIDRPAQQTFAAPFLDFTLRLLDWVETRVDLQASGPELRRRKSALLKRLAGSAHAPLGPAIELALLRDPALARRLLAALQGTD